MNSQRQQEAYIRHASYYVDVLNEINAKYHEGGKKTKQAVSHFQNEWPQISRGQARARQFLHKSKKAAQLCLKYPTFGVLTAYLMQSEQENIQWIQTGLEGARICEDRRAEMRLLNRLGMALTGDGRAKEAIQLHSEAIRLSDQLDNAKNKTIALHGTASAFFNLGNYQEALIYCEKTFKQAVRSEDKDAECLSITLAARIQIHCGKHDKGIRLQKRALEIGRQTNNLPAVATLTGNLAEAFYHAQNYPSAIEYYEKAYAIFEEIGEHREAAVDLRGLGNVYVMTGQPRKGAEYYEKALKIHMESGERLEEANDIVGLANAYRLLGDLNGVVALYERALVIQREAGAKADLANTLSNVGNVYLHLDEPRRSLQSSQEALELAREIGIPNVIGVNLLNMGIALDKMGSPAEAKEHLILAIKILTETKHPYLSVALEQLNRLEKREPKG